MRRFLRNTFVLLLLAAFTSLPWPAMARAEEAPRKLHPWATFSPGAWQSIRVFTEVFDKEGRVVDTGRIRETTTLKEVGDWGVTLEVQKSVRVAGKWLDQPPETVKQTIYGESEDQKVAIKDLEPKTLVVEGQNVPCGVREIQVADANSKRLQVSRLYFNNDVAPYLFKRETTIKDSSEGTVLSETKMLVDALRMPCRIADRVGSAAHSRSTFKHAKGMRITLAYASTEVPGGVVCRCTKELDKENRLVSRSVMELIDCGLEPPADPPRRRLFPLRKKKEKEDSPGY
ncbi:MAG: hypothetical protein JW888_18810 [Pirellulales bacterium]|nr:hypothetical protein [Pirellulales bacterium]